MGTIYTAAQAVGRFRINPQGSFDLLLENKTGAPSVLGTIVSIATLNDFAVRINPAQRIGITMVVQDQGIADGSSIWCTIHGICRVLLADGTGTTRGNWVRRHATIDGRADGTAADPPDGGNPEVYPTSTRKHLLGMGRALETVSGGTNKLAWIVMQQS